MGKYFFQLFASSFYKLLVLFAAFSFSNLNLQAQVFNYSDGWGSQGFSIETENASGVKLNFSIHQFEMMEKDVNGSPMKSILIPGTFLPNDEGEPDLPGVSRYIAVPQGANVTFEIISSRTDQFTNMEIAPAPRIPLDTDPGPLSYNKDLRVYDRNDFYPESPVILSEPQNIRGVDARIVGITPFQYNPVTKELIVYRDMKVNISFTGGNGKFGEDRLRNRWWDPMLKNIFLNYSSLPNVEYKRHSDSETEDFEYIIITPDNPDYLPWADTIKSWRTKQGIRTGIVTLTQIGGNNATLIENYINNAYNTWDIPPVAVLFLADYGTGGATGNGIMVPTYSGGYTTCISDNLYADVNGDQLPDIVAGRLVAQSASHFEIMVHKFINYEQSPPHEPYVLFETNFSRRMAVRQMVHSLCRCQLRFLAE
ncbi:MAG: C25 family peptidase propeptide domain-containing protein [Ignavibacteriaceae bacterium]|nr:C25 family peptidase propeptide domain-containing protein [Ignavibacteriaceae bacterium]